MKKKVGNKGVVLISLSMFSVCQRNVARFLFSAAKGCCYISTSSSYTKFLYYVKSFYLGIK